MLLCMASDVGGVVLRSSTLPTTVSVPPGALLLRLTWSGVIWL